LVRVAVIDYELCKPDKCNKECIVFCPVNKTGGKAIEMDPSRKKPVIYEETCIGCGICVRKCPFKAIYIVNLPDELEKMLVHRHGVNGFKLYGLPVPREGKVLGILGKNGTGKTTALRILAGELRPNLGQPGQEPSWDEIIKRFRGTEIQNYFRALKEGKIRPAHKIQYIDIVPRRVKGTVAQLLERADERGIWRELVKELGLKNALDKDIRVLSGGELQRFLIAAVLSKDANLYLFDEPGSYLDVRERVNVARVIRNYVPKGSYVVVVEHDIAMLDYLSDHVVIMYGEPGVYGIASKPYAVGAGINHFLKGYLPAENMRIRNEPIRYTISPSEIVTQPGTRKYIEWRKLVVELNGFALEAEPGELYEGEVLGILGPNAIGKTTFVRTLAGEIDPKEGEIIKPSEQLKVSYKPQRLSPQTLGEDKTVEELLREANPSALSPGSWINVEIVKRLGLDKFLDRKVGELSGGELQKVAVAVALAKEADIYLLDEPSAYLDVEERLVVAKAIKRLTEARKAAAIVVEHDIAVQDYISNRVMVFTGVPGRHGYALKPLPLYEGMNKFLAEIGITIRKDPETGRPRINKEGSYLDRLQRRLGKYYYIPSPGEKEEKQQSA
jgi:ATP-binding cassette subfamily E protein 1